MNRPVPPGEVQVTPPLFALLALLWLAGAAIRIPLLAVPPVIPLIHDDLHLSETQVGILSGLPMVLFAAAAIAGSLMIARLGALTALLIGLVLCAVGSALRSIGPHIAMLYFGTIVTAFGVAVMQPSLPPLVRTWVPQRIGFATAVYTNGLLIGEILPVSLMLPVVMPMVGQSWQWSFVVWSAPVGIIALVVMILAPRPAAATGPATPRRRWWPDWRRGLIWRLGLVLGTVNATYFSTNAFLPDYLREHGQGEWISAALSGLNIGQLPASFILLAIAGRLERKAWPYVGCAVIGLLATGGIVFGSGYWIVVAASLQGFANAGILILVLALPPLLSAPDDVHRVTAAMFTISYSCAVIVPVISGMLWDLSGIAAMAFLPIALCGILLVILAPAINHVPRQET